MNKDTQPAPKTTLLGTAVTRSLANKRGNMEVKITKIKIMVNDNSVDNDNNQ